MGDFLSDGRTWLVDNLTLEVGQPVPVTLFVDGEEPFEIVDPILTEDKRIRRKEARGIRIVDSRQLTMTDVLPDNHGFSGLMQGKLTATVLIEGQNYAVERCVNHRGAIVFELTRDAMREQSRPNYRGRADIDSRGRGR